MEALAECRFDEEALEDKMMMCVTMGWGAGDMQRFGGEWGEMEKVYRWGSINTLLDKWCGGGAGEGEIEGHWWGVLFLG